MAAPTGEDLVAGIKEILANSELDSLTSKKVRKALEARFEQDLSERKKEIDQLLMDELAAGQAAATSSAQSPSPPPKKKARKKSESEASEESDLDLSGDGSGDEAVARRLHEAENGRGRKAKGKAKEEKKPRKKTGGRGGGGGSIYSKECLISEELARVLGTDRMARKDVVSNMWKIIKERNLQDPKNKQFVNCDDDLYSVFKTKRFKAFGMMKYLKTHIKDAHFVSDGKEAA